jgi:hypothetical protein
MEILTACCQCTYVFLSSVKMVPDDGCDELEHVAHCCMAIEYCVLQYTLYLNKVVVVVVVVVVIVAAVVVLLLL